MHYLNSYMKIWAVGEIILGKVCADLRSTEYS